MAPPPPPGGDDDWHDEDEGDEGEGEEEDGDFEEDDDPTELKIENVLWLELYAIYNYLTPRTVKRT